MMAIDDIEVLEGGAVSAMRTAAIILAAGFGSRMGRDKMRLDWNGRPLPAWPVLAAIEAGLDPVIVVLAPGHDDLARALTSLGARIAINFAPEGGMGGSLRCGIEALTGESEAVAVLLGDMPLVSSGLLRRLVAELAPARGITITAPVRAGRRGNPVVFHHSHLRDLAAIEGDVGARGLLERHSAALGLIETEEAGVHADLDTPADFERLPGKI